MVKAKDLLKKAQPDSGEPQKASQEEKVAEAYENISKRIEALRSGDPLDEEIDKDDQTKEQAAETDKADEEPTEEAEKQDEGEEEEKEAEEAEKAAEEGPSEQTLDDLAEEEANPRNLRENDDSQIQIPNLHSSKPSLNFHYQQRSPQVTKQSVKWQLLVLALVGIGVIFGAIYLLKNQPLGTPKPSPTPGLTTTIVTPAPTQTPNPTIAPEEKAKLKVKILNGTGKTGLASSVAAKLKALGYKTDRVGNATNSAFTQTVVRVKSKAETLLAQLIKDLAPEFNAVSSTFLQDSDSADAEVILGTK